MLISIVIPAFNEEKRLPNTLKKIISYISSKKIQAEILVVDDGSKDDTSKIAKSFAKSNVKLLSYGCNRGKGYAVRYGVLHSKGDLVLFSDADLSTPIEELEHFLVHIYAGFDIVIASRALPKSSILIHQPWYRELMGKSFNAVVRALAVKKIHDTQCGFKLFTKHASKIIFSKAIVEGFGFDVELLFLAQKFGLRIREEPVQWINSKETKVSPVKDTLSMLGEIVKIRFNETKGLYD